MGPPIRVEERSSIPLLAYGCARYHIHVLVYVYHVESCMVYYIHFTPTYFPVNIFPIDINHTPNIDLGILKQCVCAGPLLSPKFRSSFMHIRCGTQMQWISLVFYTDLCEMCVAKCNLHYSQLP